MVELATTEDKMNVLKKAKKIKGNAVFENVYINPDQNEAERKLTKELVKDRNEKNKILEKEGKLNQPFRYGIRGNGVVKIYIKTQQ